MEKKKILVIVDPQNDFIEGGALGVTGAREAMDNLADHLIKNKDEYSLVIVTHDWHPENHCSFTECGGIWPEHCVEGTRGSETYNMVQRELHQMIGRVVYIMKGDKPAVEEYSAFAPTNKENYKKAYDRINDFKNKFNEFSDITFVIAGIAGDYCVQNTVHDMLNDKSLATANYELLTDCIASIDGGTAIDELIKELDFHNHMNSIGHIITHFTDNDLYTFTCQYFVLMNFPRAIMEYNFFDRNNTVYPPGFARELRRQMDDMKKIVITDREIEFMKKKIDFLPDWYYTFLRGYRFNPDEVDIFQDKDNHLHIDIDGFWYSTICWEMPILSTISEMMHIYYGHDLHYNKEKEYFRAYDKAQEVLDGGVKFADMGTRRRFSFAHQDLVISAMKECQQNNPDSEGKIVGTSNVWFAMKYDMTPIGTMSHQVISFVEGTMSSPFEVNYVVMDMWSNTFNGNCGIYLNDCFTSKTFLNSLSLRQAKLWDGIRIDSGDNYHEADIMIDKWKSLGIDPMEKNITFSNGLNNKEAIALTKYCKGKCRCSVGQGTFNTCDLDIPDCKPMNIVVKAVCGSITETRERHPLIKISNDNGKSVGDAAKCRYTRRIIEEC